MLPPRALGSVRLPAASRMSEHSVLLSAAAPQAVLMARRARAFSVASRHTARVRRLRLLLIGGAVLLIGGIVVVTLLDPFGRTVSGVSIDGATVDGTKVTMLNPRLSGFQKDGRPYAIEAARAIQDIKAPTLFDLRELKVRLTMPDRSLTRITADVGAFNSTAETMSLSSGAHVVGDNGLDAVAADALVEFSANRLTTTKPVTVRMPGKRIAADAMSILEGGGHVSFVGHVHTDIDPAVQSTARGPAAPQAAP